MPVMTTRFMWVSVVWRLSESSCLICPPAGATRRVLPARLSSGGTHAVRPLLSLIQLFFRDLRDGTVVGKRCAPRVGREQGGLRAGDYDTHGVGDEVAPEGVFHLGAG